MLDNRKIIWDAECEMKDSYAVTSSAKASVDGVEKIFDTGGGYTKGVCDINVTSLPMSSSSGTLSKYTISVQAAADSSFATPIVDLCSIELGKAAAIRSTRNSSTGIYKLFWHNMFGNTVYRYLRVYTTCSGSVTTGITYTAQFAKFN